MSGPLGADLAVQVPDVAEPIRAYRSWDVTHLGLKGFESTIWPVALPLRARCLYRSYRSSLGSYGSRASDPHQCPSPPGYPDHMGHGCGIYAYKTLDACMDDSWRVGGGSRVFGEVLLWGQVYEHEMGYRAEWAKPAAIYELPMRAGMVTPASVSEFYGVPLVEPDVDLDAWNLRAQQRALEFEQQRMAGTSVRVNQTFYGSSAFTSSSPTVTFDFKDEPKKKPNPVVRWAFPAIGGSNIGTGIANFITGDPVLGGIFCATGVGFFGMWWGSWRG